MFCFYIIKNKKELFKMCVSFLRSLSLYVRLTLSTCIYLFFYYFPQWKKKKKRSTFYHYYICSFYYLPLISSFLFVPIYIQIFIFLFVFLDLNIYHPFQLLLVVHIQNDLYLFDNNNVLHVPLYVKSLDNQH